MFVPNTDLSGCILRLQAARARKTRDTCSTCSSYVSETMIKSSMYANAKVGASGPRKFAFHDALKLRRSVPETERHALIT
jgi:hypothetical protein